jgi:heptosyltransferase-1
MSSMGDVFHTFPALTDAQQAIPGLVVDWIVEEAFAEIPAWHPVVDRVLPINLRQWRKQPFTKQTRREVREFFQQANQQKYDLVIDAQGLLKSAWVTQKMAIPKHQKVGLDWASAREKLASLFYGQKVSVAKDQHAITRLRELFAKAVNYPILSTPINYGLNHQSWLPLDTLKNQNYVVCLHGTTWTTKYWPEDHWQALISKLNQQGYQVVLPWGNAEEHARSHRLAAGVSDQQAWCPTEALKLNDMARLLKHATAVVSVDTGLSHVAAALDVPLVVLYRVTDPKRVGAKGQKVSHLCSPLAPKYIKKFQPGQEKASLEGIGVEDVLHSLQQQVELKLKAD